MHIEIDHGCIIFYGFGTKRMGTESSHYAKQIVTTQESPQLFYMHVPKTGGTSIQAVMKECDLFTAPYKTIDGQKLPRPTDHYTLAERDVLNAAVDLKQYDVLCTIRDPVARFMSDAQHYKVSPETFKDMCSKAQPSDVFENGKDVYQHCRPQTDYTHTPEGDPLCTYIVRQDNINEEVPSILQKYGCAVHHMPKMNVSHKQKIELSDSVLSFIQNKYKRDYELLFTT